MYAAAVVIPLVALVFPILLLLAALAVDALMVTYVVYRMWTDRWAGQLLRVGQRLTGPWSPVRRRAHA
jgi:hypothetical protein